MNGNKLSQILDKIDSNAEIIGGAFGVLGDPMGNGRGVAGSIPFMVGCLKQWHPPDPMKIFDLMMAHPQHYHLSESVMGILAGWGIQEFGGIIDPRISKLGKITKKMSIGSLIGTTIGGFLWLARLNPSGVAPGTHTWSPPAGTTRLSYQSKMTFEPAYS